jgi:LCP family protein required for cell wall assembly
MWSWLRRVLVAVLVICVVAIGWLVYRAYNVYHDVAKTYVTVPTLADEPTGTPVTNFFGTHRVNFLVLGSDNDKKTEERHPLTQSMIVVSINPVNDKVTLLSIPRDFWVNIPGHGKGKIDLAAKYGWVPLARDVVEKYFHIKIDYYAWVGLSGFSSVVNDFGGVTVNVTHPILDDFYPNDQIKGNPYTYTRIFLVPGWRHLSGRLALEYVRSRHGDANGDFGRSNRQQQVLLQLRRKANGWNLFFKIPQLASDLSNSVQDDVPPTKLLDLARLARHINGSNIQRIILSAPTYCTYASINTPIGIQDVLLPKWKKILPLVRKYMGPVAVPTATVTPRPTATPAVSATATPGPSALPSPSTTPRPHKTATQRPQLTATPQPPTLSRLPGSIFYVAGGTIWRIDRTRHTADVMPKWMSAATMPSVSRNGQKIVFMRWAPYASNVFTYNVHTRANPRKITNPTPADPKDVNDYLWAAFPSWSADGKTILYSSDLYKRHLPATESRQLDLAIYAMSPDGSNIRQLTTITAQDAGAGGDTDPQFRGKGTQFLYVHWAYHRQNGLAVGTPYSQLRVGDVDNPSFTVSLTPPSGAVMQPALDRTGRHVVYVQSGEDASKIVEAQIVHGGAGLRLAHQRVLATGQVGQPAFSPNGRWVSFLQAAGDGFSLQVERSTGGQSATISQVGTGLDASSRPVWGE